MEGVLIKENSGYSLSVDNKIFASTDGHPLKAIGNKLSLTNCQAIECEFNLDELVLDYEKENEEHIQVDERQRQSFKAGFQKALELMGDKNFSKADIRKAMDWIMSKYFEFHEQPTTGIRENFIHSLQQTEWDVEIEEKEVCGWDLHADPPEKIFSHLEPKLDSQGCLILKRKQ